MNCTEWSLVDTEAGVVLDLLDTMSRHLSELEVTGQRRLAEMKYKLLSRKVDPNDKKLVYSLALQALENGMHLLNLFCVPPPPLDIFWQKRYIFWLSVLCVRPFICLDMYCYHSIS